MKYLKYGSCLTERNAPLGVEAHCGFNGSAETEYFGSYEAHTIEAKFLEAVFTAFLPRTDFSDFHLENMENFLRIDVKNSLDGRHECGPDDHNRRCYYFVYDSEDSVIGEVHEHFCCDKLTRKNWWK